LKLIAPTPQHSFSLHIPPPPLLLTVETDPPTSPTSLPSLFFFQPRNPNSTARRTPNFPFQVLPPFTWPLFPLSRRSISQPLFNPLPLSCRTHACKIPLFPSALMPPHISYFWSSGSSGSRAFSKSSMKPPRSRHKPGRHLFFHRTSAFCNSLSLTLLHP